MLICRLHKAPKDSLTDGQQYISHALDVYYEGQWLTFNATGTVNDPDGISTILAVTQTWC